ncbi:MAG TPA: HD domain-containing protein [Spirochaetota bacterium]|nr:HD domain-containing protein [Spirochaetota bacterium]
MTKRQGHNLVFVRKPNDIVREVKYILNLINPEFDLSPISRVFCDTLRLFGGKYEGYRACNTRYHDIEHTVMVFLASARLVHAVAITGRDLREKDIDLCLTASLFHDAGFIQTDDDIEGTGAKYSIGHERRSIEFIRTYLGERGYSDDQISACASMIECTILAVCPRDIVFRDGDVEILGKIVGTADLVAQIADRIYLEKLLYLYEEFAEAHIPGFDSELELLKKTGFFYEEISKKRLNNDLGGVSRLMHHHFRERWNIDKDLYEEYIKKNIDYLKGVLQRHEENYRTMLKRGGIVKGITV